MNMNNNVSKINVVVSKGIIFRMCFSLNSQATDGPDSTFTLSDIPQIISRNG